MSIISWHFKKPHIVRHFLFQINNWSFQQTEESFSAYGEDLHQLWLAFYYCFALHMINCEHAVLLNIFCVPQNEVSQMGSEQHEGEYETFHYCKYNSSVVNYSILS